MHRSVYMCVMDGKAESLLFSLAIICVSAWVCVNE
jgi:hypothetical protein